MSRPFFCGRRIAVYDDWLSDERVLFLSEPQDLESSFRRLTPLRHAAPKECADSYLIAFAEEAGLHLVTFDKAMARRACKAIQLRSE